MNFHLLRLKRILFFRYYFYITPPPTVYNWLAFFQPFHKEIWFAVTLTILVLSGTWYILMKFCPKSNEKDKQNKPFDFFIFIFMGLLCQKGKLIDLFSKLPKKVCKYSNYFLQEVLMSPMLFK